MESLAARMNMTPEQMLTYLLRCYKENPKVSDFAEAWRIQFEYALRRYDEVDFVFPTGIKWDPAAIPTIQWMLDLRNAVLGKTPAELNPEEGENCWGNLSGEDLEKIEQQIDFERHMSVAEGRYKD